MGNVRRSHCGALSCSDSVSKLSFQSGRLEKFMRFVVATCAVSLLFSGCSGSDSNTPGGESELGGATGAGGNSSSSGGIAAAGTGVSGGNPSTGGAAQGGSSSTAAGGVPPTGGTQSTTATGGAAPIGGTSATTGTGGKATGGTTSGVGGSAPGGTNSGGKTGTGGGATGGAGGVATGGTTSGVGGSPTGGLNAGGKSSTGGAAAGGTLATGGTGTGPGSCATVTVNSNGAYSVTFKSPAWTFSGNLGASASGVATTNGSDKLGSYCETTFTYSASGARNGRIRSYANTPVVVFGEANASSVSNTRNFPKLTSVPSLPYHITYGGVFVDYSMTDVTTNGDSPWVYFDASGNAFIISGGSHFMNTSTSQASGGGIVSGIQSDIGTLPAGFETTTVLAADTGINKAYEDWGQALLSFTGKTPVASDATPVLGKFGCWFDNGSYYSYKTETGKNYETTLKDVVAYYQTQGSIPVAYVQLDSWWYPKGAAQSWSDSSSGIYQYTAHPTVFPNGLASFQQSTGLGLITHARWIDTASPYRSQYQFSADVIVDPAYWKSIASYLKSCNVTTYEQDWLAYKGSPATNNLTDQDAYLDNMASAMAGAGIDMQYCMARARQIMQSTKYNNLTNARVSDDAFERKWWRTFFYGSRLAWSVRVWPWTDNFGSGERDNLLISNLSAGIFGGSDQIGSADFASIKRALRADGTIIKPDVPILLMDRSIIDEAKGGPGATFATTYTQHTGGRFTYVFVFSDKAGVTASFTPAELGYTGNVYVYDVNADSGKVLSSTQASTATLATTDTTAYYVVAPIGSSGIAFLGEKGKIASVGKKRISSVSDDGTLSVSIAYGQGEGPVTLQGYAPAAPTVTATTGTAGTVSYSASTQRFTVQVTAAGTAAMIRITP